MIKTVIAIGLWLVLALHLALAMLGGSRWVEARWPGYLPWVPLAIGDRLGPATRSKLLGLEGDLSACLDTLQQAGLVVSTIEMRAAEPQCRIPDAVSLGRMHYPYAPASAPMSCPLAVALGLWERHVVQTAAETYLDSPVARIHHYGTYNCRAVRNSRSGSWSRHATATAIDIAAFELDDGSRISVLRHYDAEGPSGDFLRAVKRGGCTVFGTVLSPEYNAAHADHFHLQQRGGLCR